MSRSNEGHQSGSGQDEQTPAQSSDAYFQRTVEQSVMAAVLRAADPSRRQFLARLGGAALTALVAEVFPLERLKAFAADR